MGGCEAPARGLPSPPLPSPLPPHHPRAPRPPLLLSGILLPGRPFSPSLHSPPPPPPPLPLPASPFLRRSDALQSIYPLDSSSPATAEQLTQVDEIAKAQDLPTSGCCTAAQKFDGASCQCDTTLPTLLGTLGLTSSTAGLKGYINLTRSLCNFSGSDC